MFERTGKRKKMTISGYKMFIKELDMSNKIDKHKNTANINK